LSGPANTEASFEVLAGDRSRVEGSLDFATVAHLLEEGSAAIRAGRAAVIDLGGVVASDSSGLALLIEWMSVAKQSAHPLAYEEMPAQLHQLARLSEVEDLLQIPAAHT
jgi:phospholipid transport system transporter-binding protein